MFSFLAQTVGGLPNQLPWQQNWIIDAIIIGFTVGSIVLIIAWTWSGRTKGERQLPFERTAEDFNGQVQAAYGSLPVFLVIAYVLVLASIAGYIVVSILNGPQY